MNMINRVSCWIDLRFSKPLMLCLFLIVFGFFWVFNFSPLPISNAEFIKLSGQEGLLDTLFFYSSQEAFTALTNYGEEGRELYLGFLTADFIFIIFYSFAFAFLMTIVVRAVCGNNSHWLKLNVLPLSIGFFDCIENISILGMLKIYPLNSTVLGTVSGSITLCKWILTIVTISFLIYGSIIILLRQCGLKNCAVQPSS